MRLTSSEKNPNPKQKYVIIWIDRLIENKKGNLDTDISKYLPKDERFSGGVPKTLELA